tara:strand:- start:840 stop:1001 length:162 start_codon:yes stop_codon:yes gene_type:complete
MTDKFLILILGLILLAGALIVFMSGDEIGGTDISLSYPPSASTSASAADSLDP